MQNNQEVVKICGHAFIWCSSIWTECEDIQVVHNSHITNPDLTQEFTENLIIFPDS